MGSRHFFPTAPEMITACIGLGSNLGDSHQILQDAWNDLVSRERIEPVALSSPFRSEPVDMESEHWFVNAAALIRTSLPAHELLQLLLDIEALFGRLRDGSPGHQDRTLDLDLLLYGDLVLSSDRLTLPHPQMHSRGFVLEPLAEITPGTVHPILGLDIRTLCELLRSRPDQPLVERISWQRVPNH
ncbi:2-amino-4-hydroxy-6-hydroxymethyldihydropteridine diphosphokinase [Desulfolithobacter sp.]